MRGICNEAFKLRWNASLRFSRAYTGNAGSLGRHHRFLTLRQCLLPFIQCFFTSVQLRFTLSQLLLSRGILLLARPKQSKGNQQRKDENFFHISGGIEFCSVDEQNGEHLDVKQNLALLRCRRWRSCRFNYDSFRIAAPKMLKIGKNSQHRQANDNDQHQ